MGLPRARRPAAAVVCDLRKLGQRLLDEAPEALSVLTATARGLLRAKLPTHPRRKQ